MKVRIPLNDGQALAGEVVALLAPACDKIEVAGSIRRQQATVGDIEIVAVPRVHRSLDLFGEPIGPSCNDLDALCDDLLQQGILDHRLDKNDRRAWGERYKRAHFVSGDDEIPLDLFAVLPPRQWGVIFTIRTGPWDFSKALVTGKHVGGAMPMGWMVRDGQLLAGGPDRVVDTPEEKDFFAALGINWIPPGERSVERLKAEVLKGQAS